MILTDDGNENCLVGFFDTGRRLKNGTFFLAMRGRFDSLYLFK